MDDISDEESEPLVKFPTVENRITSGAILQIVIIVSGFVIGGIHVSDKLDETSKQVQNIELTVSAIPREAAEISSLQSHANQTDAALTLINSQIHNIFADTIKNTADIENIKQASQYRLKGR